MKTIDQWLTAVASEIETRLREELKLHLCGLEKHLTIEVVREYTDYQFTVRINNEFAWMSRSLNYASHDSSDHLDIDSIIEEIAVGIKFGIRHHQDWVNHG